MGQPLLEDEIQAVLMVWETVFVGAVREPQVQVLFVDGANEADRHSSLASLLVPGALFTDGEANTISTSCSKVKGGNGGCSIGLELYLLTLVSAYISLHYFMSVSYTSVTVLTISGPTEMQRWLCRLSPWG